MEIQIAKLLKQFVFSLLKLLQIDGKSKLLNLSFAACNPPAGCCVTCIHGKYLIMPVCSGQSIATKHQNLNVIQKAMK